MKSKKTLPLTSSGPRTVILLGLILARVHSAVLYISVPINMQKESLPFKWSTRSSYADRFVSRFSRLCFWTKRTVTAKHWGTELYACHSSIKVKIMCLSNPSSSILDCLSTLFQTCHVHEMRIILSQPLLNYIISWIMQGISAIRLLFCFAFPEDFLHLFSFRKVQ